jgi:glycosyltransferase involved in cell wall biosynthesis
VFPISRVVQAKKGHLTEATDEAVVGIEMVQAFGREDDVRERFTGRAEAVRAETMRQAGIEVSYDWLLDAEQLKVFYGQTSPAKKAAVAAHAFARRVRSLGRDAPDVYFVQREAFFLGNEWAEYLAHLKAPVVFDFDDAIWLHAVSAANARFAWLKNVEKIPRVVRLAHTVLAGNEYLATWARKHSNNVHLVPTCVDTERFRPAPHDAGAITIGWSGSASTLAHLKPLLPVLERVKQKYGDRIHLRVMGDPSFEHAPLKLRGETWTPEAELSMLRTMNIGVMPLPDDEWTRGKCGLKGLVSMSMGAATVMSPVGVNTEIVKHGENGLLARNDDEWFEHLSALIDDAALRARLGKAGRETVEQRYSVHHWGPRLVELLLATTR